jgi:hypothetical protein
MPTLVPQCAAAFGKPLAYWLMCGRLCCRINVQSGWMRRAISGCCRWWQLALARRRSLPSCRGLNPEVFPRKTPPAMPFSPCLARSAGQASCATGRDAPPTLTTTSVGIRKVLPTVEAMTVMGVRPQALRAKTRSRVHPSKAVD